MNRRGEPNYGLYVPNFGRAAHPSVLAKLAVEAEKSGWDGFFLWDHLVEWNKPIPVYETFTSLSAIAVGTSRIRIGTTISPLPKYKPWIIARKTVALDHLSNGRLTLGVGLGAIESTDYGRFGEAPENHVLAEKLDESLKIITGLWTGKRFKHRGKHFSIKETIFRPSPLQRPRIPIWVAGFWPHKAPFKRAVRWDGVVPLRMPGRLAATEDIKKIASYVQDHRPSKPDFDIVTIGWTMGVNRVRDREKVLKYQEAGTTWWLESMWTKRERPEEMKARIRKGPPS